MSKPCTEVMGSVGLGLLGESDDRELEKLEEKVWDPTSPLSEKQIDQFLVVAR